MYANELAQRGFIVLTFDPCYMGESEGYPRRVSSPDLFSENISAGVDYLGLLPYVDREKIYGLGICGSGGFLISAASVDTRIKKSLRHRCMTCLMQQESGFLKNNSKKKKNGYPINVGRMRKTDIPNISLLSGTTD